MSPKEPGNPEKRIKEGELSSCQNGVEQTLYLYMQDEMREIQIEQIAGTGYFLLFSFQGFLHLLILSYQPHKEKSSIFFVLCSVKRSF